MKDLTKGNITKLLFGFAVPLFIGNVLQLTYSLIDTRIVGSILGESALAAVGATTSLSNLIIGFLQGLTNGFAIIVAQHFGAGNYKDLKKSVALSVMLGLAMSLILTVLSLVFLYPLLRVLNIPKAVIPDSAAFISIIFAGMTITMLYNICAAVLRAIGDSVTPLIFLALSVILNIFGDLFLINVLHTGVRGAAVATVLSQLAALICCFLYMWKKYEFLRFSLCDMQPNGSMLRNLLSCGFSMGFMSSFVSLGSVALQTSINKLGPYRRTEDFGTLYACLQRIWNDNGNLLRTESGGRTDKQNPGRYQKGDFDYLGVVSWYHTLKLHHRSADDLCHYRKYKSGRDGKCRPLFKN